MTGRPSSFTQKTADEICHRIAEGESLRSICVDDDMPSMESVRRWLIANEVFRVQYARAREDQADYYFDEIITIADTEMDANRARVRIDARKWTAGKLRPKVYGDKVEATLKNAEGETFKTEEVGALGNRVAFALMKGIDAET